MPRLSPQTPAAAPVTAVTWVPKLYSHRVISQLLTTPRAIGCFQASAFCFTGQKTGERRQCAFDSITKPLLQRVAEGNPPILASMFRNGGPSLIGCKLVCPRNRIFGFNSPGRNKPNESFWIHVTVLRTEGTITSWRMLRDRER